MDPRNPNSYSIAQADLFGPVPTYVPGREQSTRHKPALAAKCWAMAFTCLLSKATNIQAVEGHSTPLLAQGLSRMSCEEGTPAGLLPDIETHTRVRTTMDLQLCPVSGHNLHGQMEARIKTAQDTLEKVGFYKERVHATGLQTALKLIESDINSTPLPDRLSCGCCCHPHHALESTDTTPTTSFPPDSPLVPNPAPDDTPDILLDAGARDELDPQQDTSLSHILTLGALPLSVGQQPF